jgi:large subunit ribosomal protein L9
MEIILLDNIDDLGTVGQTVRVKNGYARNFLLPKKLACEATQKNLNYYRALIEAKQKKLAKLKGSATERARQLESIVLSFVRKSRGEDGRLFGSVTTADIARALEAQGFEIDKKKIALPEPIKKLGEYKAEVRLHPEVTASVSVAVKPEEQSEDAG